MWLIGAAAVVVLIAIVLIATGALRTSPAAPNTPAPTSIPAIAAATPVIVAAATAAPPTEATTSAPSAQPTGVARLLNDSYEKMMDSDTEAALSLVQQALTAEPDNAHALVARAVIELNGNGDVRAVTADLDRAAQTIPDDPLLHYGRGLIYMHGDKSDPIAAERKYTQAIDTCGDYALMCAAISSFQEKDL